MYQIQCDQFLDDANCVPRQVGKEKEVADAEEKKVAKINEEVGKKQRDCERDLAKAEPALKAASEALNTLNKVSGHLRTAQTVRRSGRSIRRSVALRILQSSIIVAIQCQTNIDYVRIFTVRTTTRSSVCCYVNACACHPTVTSELD